MNLIRPNLKLWIRLIAFTGFAQILIQALGFLGGIMIVRLMPVEEYAYYTLGNTMLGTMIMLSDSGISTGVMSQGGKVWQDSQKLGRVLVTGMDLRNKFAIGALIFAIPVLFILLHKHGAGWLVSIAIIIALVPSFFSVLSASILEVAPKLQQDVTAIQKIQVSSNVFRIMLLGASIIFFPFSYVAILAGGIPQIWSNLRMRKVSSKYANYKQQPDPVVRNNIFHFVKNTLPVVIYYCFASQLTIWLVSIFGSTSLIAEVGVLGRMSVIINIIAMLVGTLVIPRFARLPAVPEIIRKRFFQLLLGLAAFCGCISIIVWIFSSPILWVFGKAYAHLQIELVLCILASCISLIASELSNVCISRGWIINPILLIVVNIISIVIGLMVLNTSTLIGLFTLNIFLAIVQLTMNILFGLSKLKTLQLNR